MLRIALDRIVIARVGSTQCDAHILNGRAGAVGDTARDDTTGLTETGIGERVLLRAAAVSLDFVFIEESRLHGIVLVGETLRIAGGGVDFDEIVAAADVAARDVVGGRFGAYLFAGPRQAHRTFMHALRRLEGLHQRAGEQTGGDGVALKVEVADAEAYLIKIAGAPVGQVCILKGEDRTRLRFRIARDAAVLRPLAVGFGLPHHLEFHSGCRCRYARIAPRQFHLVGDCRVLLQCVDAHAGLGVENVRLHIA